MSLVVNDNKKYLDKEGLIQLIKALSDKNKTQSLILQSDINKNIEDIRIINNKIILDETNLQYLLHNVILKETTDGQQTIKGDLVVTDGDVHLGGNLIVDGTTITTNTETSLVKDNFIVLNSDGKELATLLSGISIKTDADNAYAIAYDPINESVSLGKGIMHNGEFAFTSGESKPILTRDLSTNIQNGSVLVWDAEKNIAKDGGVIDVEQIKANFVPKHDHYALEDRVLNVEELSNTVDSELKEEISNRTLIIQALDNNIETINTNINARIDDTADRINVIEDSIDSVVHVNYSLEDIQKQINANQVSYDKLWVLSFVPEYNSVNEVIGYKPAFIPMDDGILN